MSAKQYLTPNAMMWLMASEYLGLREVPGIDNNPIIMEFFRATGHTWVQDDETSWCAAFLNYIAMKCGCEYSRTLVARNWEDIGEEVSSPILGDVLVFWRGSPDGWKGHVGLYGGMDGNDYLLLGGNQDNMVCIKPYPAAQLLSIRRLKYLTEE